MPKPYPCLWFDGQAEEAAELYTRVFPNSRIESVSRSPADTPSGPEGMVLTVEFTLDGQKFLALNGGPEFAFNEAVSFVIDCQGQAEVDHYWDSLIAGGGSPSMCGWLKDRFGVSWQVVPRRLHELLGGPDPAGARLATESMLQMQKLDVATLEAAYEGGGHRAGTP